MRSGPLEAAWSGRGSQAGRGPGLAGPGACLCRHPAGRQNRHDVNRVRLFSGEGRGGWYLASRVSLPARLPRARPGSGWPRPPRCESVTVITGTPSHRYGYRGGGAARDRAAGGTAETEAAGETPGNRWPGRVLVRQRSLQKSRAHATSTRFQAATTVPRARGFRNQAEPRPFITSSLDQLADSRPLVLILSWYDI